ncbi:MAG TPA: tetratricopeptide repeat protein, partial [Pyrinomonadaceae bacterium]|nr:tetratricopeptide repeat protein [Pyrinomonadaceae bacterium]
MGELEKPIYEFGPFVLDTREKALFRDGQPVALKPKAYRVLLALVERSGYIVEKDYFMREVWDGSLREESNLPQQVSVLRKTLGEVDGENGGGKYIETVATRGYKFIAVVRRVRDRAPDLQTEADSTALSNREESGSPAASASDASLILQRHTSIRVTRNEPAHPESRNIYPNERVALPETSPAHHQLQPTPLFRLSSRGKFFAGLVVLGVVAFIVFLIWSNRWGRRAELASSNSTPVTTQNQIKSIAVTPFRTRGTTAGNEYLEIGLAEAVAMKLGGVSSLIVRPMSAVERELRERNGDHLTLGRALGVDAVLEGSIQQLGDRVRVTAQLLSVSDGRQIWSGRFDEESAQVFRIQDAISEQLVSALELNLGGGERARLARGHTKNPDAYRLYLLGRYFWRSNLPKSRTYYQQALDADPSYALAHAGLADTYAFSNGKDALHAERHAREALRLDESLAEPHATLGLVQMFARWNWNEAEKELRRALELNPNYATAHQWYAIYLACQGRTVEAVARMKRAVELDPLSPAINADLGQMHFFAGNVDEAVAACSRALELDADHPFAQLYLFYVGAMAERHSEAAEAFLRFLKVADPAGYEVRRTAYGREAGWQAMLRADINHLVNDSG